MEGTPGAIQVQDYTVKGLHMRNHRKVEIKRVVFENGRELR